MRAIIVSTGLSSGMPELTEHYPTAMIPLIDRPIIQHLVEFLASMDVNDCAFLLHHLPEQIEHHLGTGTRWGCHFAYHLIRDPSHLFSPLLSNPNPSDSTALIIADVDYLPKFGAISDLKNIDHPVMFFKKSPNDSPDIWVHWAILPDSTATGLLRDCASWDELEAAMNRLPGVEKVTVDSLLDFSNYSSYLDAQKEVITHGFTGLLLTGREVQTGVWISRNVRLHPTAHVIPPVYVGENCRIGAHVKIGPNSVICANCMIDNLSVIENSVIFPNGYVSQELDLIDSIVDRNRLISAKSGSVVTVTDEFILGSLKENSIAEMIKLIINRSLAVLAIALSSPILLMFIVVRKFLLRKPAFNRVKVVRLPAERSPEYWRQFDLLCFDDNAGILNLKEYYSLSRFRHFYRYLLPGLINILRGEMRFTGVPPRNPEAIGNLMQDWRNLYLKTQSGFIDELRIRSQKNPNPDDMYSAEAFYSVSSGIRLSFRQVISYFFSFRKADVSEGFDDEQS